MTKETGPIPDWAQQERLADQVWIAEHLSTFRLVAEASYAEEGRGSIVVDTRAVLPGAGHPFLYAPQSIIEDEGDADTKRMVREYSPDQELVIMMLKSENRTSTYRIRYQQSAGGRP